MMGLWYQPTRRLAPPNYLRPLQLFSDPPWTNPVAHPLHGRRSIRHSVWGDRHRCHRIPNGKANPRHYPYRRSLSLHLRKSPCSFVPRTYRPNWRNRRSLTCLKKTRKKWTTSQDSTTNTRKILTKASWPKIWNAFKRTHTFITWTSHTSSLLIRSKINEFYKWLVEADDGKPQGTPTLKAIWKAGDLKPRLETWNRNISRMRAHWQVRNVLLLQR